MLRRQWFVGVVGAVVALACVGIAAMVLAGRGQSHSPSPPGAPETADELARFLPEPASVPGVVPGLHVAPVRSGRAYGIVTPAELAIARGARFGVSRQWVGDTQSVVLRPGEQFPDEVFTVIATVVRFDTPDDAAAWTGQVMALVPSPVAIPITGPVPSNLAVARGSPEASGELSYLAVFTAGDVAFTLQMTAGGTTDRDDQFVRLVQGWTAIARPK